MFPGWTESKRNHGPRALGSARARYQEKPEENWLRIAMTFILTFLPPTPLHPKEGLRELPSTSQIADLSKSILSQGFRQGVSSSSAWLVEMLGIKLGACFLSREPLEKEATAQVPLNSHVKTEFQRCFQGASNHFFFFLHFTSKIQLQ